jgi:hypothetical protein
MADRAGSSAVEIELGWTRDLAVCFIGLFYMSVSLLLGFR